MFNQKTFAVMKRELREKLLSKTFLLMTFLIPVFMFGGLALQTFVMSYSGNGDTFLSIVSETPKITNELRKEFSGKPFVKKGKFVISYSTMNKETFKKFLNQSRSDLISEKLTAVIYVPESALKDKKIEYYSKNPNNNSLFEKIRGSINTALIDVYFGNKYFSSNDIRFAREGVDFNSFRVSKQKEIEKEGYGNMVVSFLLTFLLYFSLLFLGTMMMRSVVAEKTNRIVEVLLSSVSSNELMSGKIIGTAITGLVQMAIWLLPLVAVVSTSWFALPEKFTISMSGWQILYFLLNFLIGLVTFLGLFASVGAIFDNDQDAQSGLWPVMLLIMIPFFIAISLVSNPGSPIGKITSLVPFFSLMVMPARMSLVDVSLLEILGSLFINLATMVLIFMFAGKIYRVGILRTGKKPSWPEVVKWLKYKY